MIEKLKELIGSKISEVKEVDGSLFLGVSNGTSITASYWRVTKLPGIRISNFDHGQSYGLKKAIDAFGELRAKLLEQSIKDSRLDPSSGDIQLDFQDDSRLEVFNFTGNEVWEIEFNDGTGQYSNYV